MRTVPVLAFILGMLAGGTLGVFAMCLAFAGRLPDRPDEEP